MIVNLSPSNLRVRQTLDSWFNKKHCLKHVMSDNERVKCEKLFCTVIVNREYHASTRPTVKKCNVENIQTN